MSLQRLFFVFLAAVVTVLLVMSSCMSSFNCKHYYLVVGIQCYGYEIWM